MGSLLGPAQICLYPISLFLFNSNISTDSNFSCRINVDHHRILSIIIYYVHMHLRILHTSLKSFCDVKVNMYKQSRFVFNNKISFIYGLCQVSDSISTQKFCKLSQYFTLSYKISSAIFVIIISPILIRLMEFNVVISLPFFNEPLILGLLR